MLPCWRPTACRNGDRVRVLVVSQYFWPEGFRINDVVTSLQGAGCEVVVLTGQPNYPSGRIAEGFSAFGAGRDRRTAAFEIFRVPLIPRGSGGAIGLIFNYLSFVVMGCVLGPFLLRGQRFDVIFVYGVSPILQAIPAILLKWLKRAPLVVWVQDLWPQSLEVTGFVRNRWLLGAIAAVTHWIYRRADLVLGQSRAFVETLRPMSGATPVAYHPNPGDLASAAPQADEAPALRIGPGFNVVFAGNLGVAQALPTLMAAAKALVDEPDIRFVLIGDGSRRPWVEAEIARLGLSNVSLPGRFPPEAIPAILAQASVLLVSLNRSEILAQTVPSKVSTYLAAGRPIIASLDGEGAQVVEEAGAGRACPAEDTVALVAAIRELKALPDAARAAMGQSGRAYFDRHFEPRRLARDLIALFNDTIARVSKGRA
jgi:glycosyltransferase involved in cell wall biosynthesis